MSKVKDALAVIANALKTNADPEPADPKQDQPTVDPAAKDDAAKAQADAAAMVQSLIDCEGSPFLPVDADALAALNPAALAALVQEYCVDEQTEVDPAMNAGDCGDGKKPQQMENAKVSALTEADKAALAYAHKVANEAKAALVAKVVANTNIGKDVAEKMDLSVLETIANGIRPVVADYSARGLPEPDPKDIVANDMRAPSLVDAIRNSGKKE